MKPIYLYGAGGLGREIQALLKVLPEWQLAGFLDDNFAGKTVNGVAVSGIEKILSEPEGNRNVIVSVGNPIHKAAIVDKLNRIPHINFPSLIHPSVIRLDPATITMGKGCIITAGCSLTCSIAIKDYVLINLNSTVGHDVIIGNFCSIMPSVNISGAVTLEDKVLLGSGATIINSSRIGNSAKVGAGAVVIQDVPANSTAVGVPAKIIVK